jgi:hypothetical protein
MKLKKGSAAAKAFMAKIRAKKGTTKKVIAMTKNITVISNILYISFKFYLRI